MCRQLLFCFLLVSANNLIAQWQKMPSPEGGVINFVQHVESELWAGTNGGIYKSSDDGKNWVQHSDLPTYLRYYDLLQYKDTIVVLGVYIDTNSFKNVYKIFYKVGPGQNWKSKTLKRDSFHYSWKITLLRGYGLLATNQFNKDLFYYSNDFGETWHVVSMPGAPVDGSYGFGLDGDRIYLIHYAQLPNRDSVDFVYYSDDLGKNWIDAPDFFKMFLYHLSLFEDDFLLLLSYTGDSVIISEDFGMTSRVVKISITNPTKIFRDGDGDIIILGENNELLKSRDNGKSWTLSGLSEIGSVNNLIKIKNQYTLFASDQGVWSGDETLTVFKNQNSGIEATNCQRIIVSPRDEIYILSEARLYRTKKDTFKFEEVYYQRGTPHYFDRINDLIFVGDTLVISTNDNVQVSFDRGLNWTILSIPFNPTGSYLGIAYYKGHLIVANNRVYKSANWGQDWDILYEGWPPRDLEICYDRLFLISGIGTMYRFSENLNSWDFIPNIFKIIIDNDILFAPQIYCTEDRIYALQAGPYSDTYKDISYSVDSGNNWSLLQHSPLLDYPNDFFAIPSLASFKNLLFGSFSLNGVYFSNNFGNDWIWYNEGLNNIELNYIIQIDNDLYVSTNCAGIWKRPIDLNLTSGIVYEDNNNNGIQDVSEPAVRNAIISSGASGNYATSNKHGQYSIYLKTFPDTLRAHSQQRYTISNPTNYIIKNSGSNLNFGIYQLPDKKDLSIILTSIALLRPGFDNSLKVTIRNLGSVKASGVVKMKLPDKIHYRFSEPTHNFINLDTLNWNFDDLLPGMSRDIQINITADVQLQIDDKLLFEIFLITDNDLDNTNNFDQQTVVVRGSFDPNDKSVEPESNITPSQLLNKVPLVYTIRFENTGNHFAERVRIVDTLSQLLDLATLNFLSSSHLCTWKLIDHGIIEIFFDDIFLPFNKPESQGFVKFSIEAKPGLSIGTGIHNDAQIYFDFNKPIFTNKVSTIIKEITSLVSIDQSMDYIIYPNPCTKDLNVQINLKGKKEAIWKLVDINGIILKEDKVHSNEDVFLINLKEVPNGIYNLILTSEDRYFGKRLTVLR